MKQHLTITQARTLLDTKEVTALQLAEQYLEKIEKENPNLNAYLGVYESVRELAKEADKKISSDSATTLTGIPLAVKDVILVNGEHASGSSKILENYVATYDATAIAKLRAEGAVFLGRTNCDEFAMGASNENSAYGPVKNPHDITRVPGGSGGGSAAAVAADLCVAALGSDTGGSIRQPASHTGIVGLKPTYGRVSRYGLMALASSLDQIGPTTKTVTDAKIIFDCLAGIDPHDSTTRMGTISEGRKVIGVPYDLIGNHLDARVRAVFDKNIEILKNLGYEIKDISLPHVEYGIAAYYIILPAEASANLARYDGVRYGLHKDGTSGIEDYLATRGAGFGKEVRRRIILGTYVLSAGYYDSYYGQALKARDLISRDFESAFKDVSAICMPTTSGPAFKIGEKSSDPIKMYLEDLFTIPANLAGIPAINIPSGTIEEGGVELPLGIQLIAPAFGEERLFEIAQELETALNFSLKPSS